MGNGPDGIKSMKLYGKVERILNELRARGLDDDAPLTVADLVPFDQYHYQGTEAVDAALAALGVDGGSHVLDVGSGIGGPARYMAERAGCRVTALELQPDLDRVAADLTGRCGLAGRVRHLCGDILSGVAAEAGADALVSLLVFLHIPDRPALFEQCYRALRPGGAMFIEDYYLLGALDEAETRALAEKVYCPYVPDLAGYETHLREAGFTDLDLQDQTAPWSAFVRGRLAGYRRDRTRQLALHGAEVVEGLDDFYASVDRLFAGGRLGGLRIVARRP